jgi:hypothetical protein
VLIREYQTLWSFRAPGVWPLNGMQMECKAVVLRRIFSRLAAGQPVNLYDLWCRHRNILTRLTHDLRSSFAVPARRVVWSRWAAQFDSMNGIERPMVLHLSGIELNPAA